MLRHHGDDSDDLSLAYTRQQKRLLTEPYRQSTQNKKIKSRNGSRDNVSHFVRSYLAERQPAEDLRLKTSHFIPEVLHPTQSTLPEAGAAVPASSLALLKRRRRFTATYIVSAKLVVSVCVVLFLDPAIF